MKYDKELIDPDTNRTYPAREHEEHEEDLVWVDHLGQEVTDNKHMLEKQGLLIRDK